MRSCERWRNKRLVSSPADARLATQQYITWVQCSRHERAYWLARNSSMSRRGRCPPGRILAGCIPSLPHPGRNQRFLLNAAFAMGQLDKGSHEACSFPASPWKSGNTVVVRFFWSSVRGWRASWKWTTLWFTSRSNMWVNFITFAMTHDASQERCVEGRATELISAFPLVLRLIILLQFIQRFPARSGVSRPFTMFLYTFPFLHFYIVTTTSFWHRTRRSNDEICKKLTKIFDQEASGVSFLSRTKICKNMQNIRRLNHFCEDGENWKKKNRSIFTRRFGGNHHHQALFFDWLKRRVMDILVCLVWQLCWCGVFFLSPFISFLFLPFLFCWVLVQACLWAGAPCVIFLSPRSLLSASKLGRSRSQHGACVQQNASGADVAWK